MGKKERLFLCSGGRALAVFWGKLWIFIFPTDSSGYFYHFY